MSNRPPRACRKPGCRAYAASGSSYCEHHQLTSKPPAWATSTKSRHERGYGDDWYAVAAIVRAEEPVCRICKREATQQVDHITPKSMGGTNDRHNLQGVCKRCHARKTAAEGVAARAGR